MANPLAQDTQLLIIITISIAEKTPPFCNHRILRRRRNDIKSQTVISAEEAQVKSQRSELGGEGDNNSLALS